MSILLHMTAVRLLTGNQKGERLSPAAIEKLLTALANLPDKDNLQLRSPITAKFTDLLKDGIGDTIGPETLLENIYGLRSDLRTAWDSRDLRVQEWVAFELRRLYSVAVRDQNKAITGKPSRRKPERDSYFGSGREPAPKLTVLEQVLFHFQRIAETRAMHCRNPDCQHPYFFKPVGQRTAAYCSADCSEVARRQTFRSSQKKRREGNL